MFIPQFPPLAGQELYLPSYNEIFHYSVHFFHLSCTYRAFCTAHQNSRSSTGKKV